MPQEGQYGTPELWELSEEGGETRTADGMTVMSRWKWEVKYINNCYNTARQM